MPQLFTFAANWVEPVNDASQWLTNVSQAGDGTEYRVDVRVDARSFFTFTHRAIDKCQQQKVNSWLWRNQSLPIVCPLWTDARRVLVQAGSLFTVPDIDGREYKVGGKIAVIKPDGSGAYYTITAITFGPEAVALTTNKSDAVVFGSGDTMYPAYDAEIQGDVTEMRLSADVVDYQFTIKLFGRPEYDGDYSIYRNSPVLEILPNRVTEVNADLSRIYQIFDSISGKTFRVDTPQSPFVGKAYDFVLKGRGDINLMRSFDDYMRGRLNAVWMPNYQTDMCLVQPILASDSTITIKRIDYRDSYAPGDEPEPPPPPEPASNLYAWGNNFDGKLGTGDKTRRLTPTLIDSNGWSVVSAAFERSLGIKDGDLFAW
jgi:hypothetical protein